MKRKIVPISFDEADYFTVKQKAKSEHLKISVWIKQLVLKSLNSKEGK